jgi:hypothetical protein
MKTYETLLIGCSYSSVGYALAEKNTLIVEENEMADTRFYLPLKSYKTTTYQPTTSHGEKLLECINSLGLIQNGVINANGLECAFCDFISQNQLDIIFKSRVINSEWQNDHYQLFHPDKSGGANQMSLNEARIAYEKGDPVL